MDKPKILVTCPPMLGLKEQFIPMLDRAGYEAICPEVTQTLSEEQLIEFVPECVGWIIGDDPATRRVFEAGVSGELKAAVKWGIGTDNVDFEACKDLGIPIVNTPNVFGDEVADVAVGYLISLARHLHRIDRGVREFNWPKLRGVSIRNKTVGIVGYGDIGKQTAIRCEAFGLNIIIYDPGVNNVTENLTLNTWPEQIEKCDFLIFTCSLNSQNRHMFNERVIGQCKIGVSVINVARGPLIDEGALILGLNSGKVGSAALDVFEFEPVPFDSELRKFDNCVFGSHNSSNTIDAVAKVNILALETLINYLNEGL